MNYEDACTQATTDQGLDPVIAALKDAGFDATAEQTGGFCMVATVYRDSRFHYPYIGVTYAFDGTDGFLVCRYDSDDDDGTVIAEGATVADVVRHARQFTGESGGEFWDLGDGCWRVHAKPYTARECPECGQWIYCADGPFAEGDPTKTVADWNHWAANHLDADADVDTGPGSAVGFPFFRYNVLPVDAVRNPDPQPNQFCTNRSTAGDACGACDGCVAEMARIRATGNRASVLIHLNVDVTPDGPGADAATRAALDYLARHNIGSDDVALIDPIEWTDA